MIVFSKIRRFFVNKYVLLKEENGEVNACLVRVETDSYFGISTTNELRWIPKDSEMVCDTFECFIFSLANLDSLREISAKS